MTTTIEEDIYSLLTASPALTAYPLSVPTDGSFPCVVYQRIATVQNRHMTGNGLEKIRYQLTAWGKTYASSLATAKSAKIKFDLNTTNFVLATKENQLEAKEVETGLYSTILEFYIWSRK